MSTYIQVFKNKSKYSKVYLVICAGCILVGLIGLIVSLFNRSFIPLINEGGLFALLFNGIISFLIVRDSMRKAKYFVSWNDNEINYLLPKSDRVELIPFDNIESIEVKMGEVIIGLNNDQKKHFNLNYFYFPERTTVVDFFKEIKSRIEKVN